MCLEGEEMRKGCSEQVTSLNFLLQTKAQDRAFIS